jgi:hypothetical protein
LDDYDCSGMRREGLLGTDEVLPLDLAMQSEILEYSTTGRVVKPGITH